MDHDEFYRRLCDVFRAKTGTDTDRGAIAWAARKTGVPYETWRRWCRGEHPPNNLAVHTLETWESEVEATAPK